MKFQGDKNPPLVGSRAYKELYESGSIMSVTEDGTLTDQLPEVVIKAHNRNKLSKDEKKVYNKFYTGGKYNEWSDNPDYNPDKPISKNNSKTSKTTKRRFKPTQSVRHNRETYDIDAYNAVKMFRDSGASYSEEPSFGASITTNEMGLKSEGGFRAHANPILDKIHVSPKSNLSNVISEIAHVFPGISSKPSVSGTLDRIKRSIGEGKISDKSNYESPKDFEYKTHTGPNSVERKLLDKYGTKR
jgi:hypothetical protein